MQNQKLNPFLAIVPQRYVSALLKLHEKFDGKNIEWAVSGDLAEALRAVRVEPDCIEIVTSKNGAEQIYMAVSEFNPQKVERRIQQLQRNALVEEKEYPVYTRSYYFEFEVDEVKVKVHGDLQFKVGEWNWGDKFEFIPGSIYIVNKKTSLVPLYTKYELYQSLGWADRTEKIISALTSQRLISKLR
jgi:hypothetical protein